MAVCLALVVIERIKTILQWRGGLFIVEWYIGGGNTSKEEGEAIVYRVCADAKVRIPYKCQLVSSTVCNQPLLPAHFKLGRKQETRLAIQHSGQESSRRKRRGRERWHQKSGRRSDSSLSLELIHPAFYGYEYYVNAVQRKIWTRECRITIS